MGRTIKVILLLFLIGILINAWDCGTFANAIDRLGCKMIWLLPLSTILLILKIKMYKKETNEINESQ